MAEWQRARSIAYHAAGPMTADLVGTSGFAAIPTTALDLPLVQRLRRSPRFRVRVPIRGAWRHRYAPSSWSGLHLCDLAELGQHIGLNA